MSVRAKIKGDVQVLIVSGVHDDLKYQFLKNLGLSCVLEWYIGGIV